MEANPRLVVVSGPLQGTVFPLEDETSIGRDPSNRICINAQWVSRKHCLFQNDGGKITIADLDSHNGTFVNGDPAKERQLEHGDRIDIANSSFVFLEHEDESLSSLVQVEEQAASPRSTIQLRREDALYLNPDLVLKASLPASRMERDLSALLRVSKVITTIRDIETLQQRLLDQIFEIIPAESGAILLGPEESGDFASEFGRYRSSIRDKSEQTVQVSRTIVEQVLKDATSVLAHLPENTELSGVESLAVRAVQSVLAVPLVVGERTIGVLYLDTCDPKVRFDEDHLELLTAVASMAAAALENARRLAGLEAENRQLKEEFGIEHNMVGEGKQMQRVYNFIAKAAPTDATVLISGESGTGKELAARAIHRNSSRTQKSFVKVDCTTLTENLLESELFGHEKGAFTGAIGKKKGKLEMADRGTVFLDELGELPPPLQSKLLRVLQDREFERVGGIHPIRVDVRVIAATNRDLKEEVKEGKFREDLYYRLNVVTIVMPPLRERREDIPGLANHFVDKYTKRVKRRIEGISREAMTALRNYDWPGNVRELENTVERAIVLGSTSMILPEDLAESVLEAEVVTDGSVDTYHEALTVMKKKLITDAVKQTGGNYTEAAKQLGLHPNYLHRLIKNLHLKEELKNL